MYIIIEMQTNNGSTALVPAQAFNNRDQAEAAYHTALAAAAVSSIQVHTVVMLDEHGNTLARQYYEHR